MRYYMDIFTSRIAAMQVNDDRSVVFDGVAHTSDEEALAADPSAVWMQSGYDEDEES